MSLTAWYAARGVPPDALAAAAPAELAFLTGSRALYYEEIPQLIAAGIRMALGGDDDGR